VTDLLQEDHPLEVVKPTAWVPDDALLDVLADLLLAQGEADGGGAPAVEEGQEEMSR
jgi:hypothetical protein